MYNEIFENLEKQCSQRELQELKGKTIHLGIFSEPYLTFMLEGKKTIESRFTKNKVAPYHQISKDDIVIVKKSSGNILAYFTIKNVMFIDLSITSIEKIKQEYHKELCVDETFWNEKKNSRYVTLLFIAKLVQLKPFLIHKKGMQTWIKLN